ncbi:hypothetical protein [Mycolicibacterium mucogenicum]|uniref:Head-to-tail adaptor n=1 Tax=Mycolicibacterium mucogenicum DSM 44124 TaxID=1226753 RepID=A0A8H2JGR8_MYCMU|nr:hypothetical protein [Mycolicibacterium mucogenicum]KAB7752768.1 hypothetical protein MMUC44124_26480 [Mycolicibacterium mucogenicum DSM 44124]QPG69090.1 hypothetical protein C1S78_027505 [Mycolicibacterium mucogenicum DSM 44124]
MPLVLPEPYATATDLENYWRTLSEAEQGRATTLLGWAAKLINEQPGSASFDELTCAQVSMDMVKRAMINGDGVSESTSSQTMDVVSAAVTNKYVNPTGALYLTNAESDRLAGRPVGGAGFSIKLGSNTRVPGYPWNHQGSGQVDAPT